MGESRFRAGTVLRPQWLVEQRDADPDAALFAEYLAFAEVVPFDCFIKYLTHSVKPGTTA